MKRIGRVLLAVLFAASAMGLISCGRSHLVGVALSLTGPQSSLGVDVRDCILMAEDDVSAHGGLFNEKKNREQGESLLSAFKKTSSIEGLQGTIRFSPFADALRAPTVEETRDGSFKTL